MVLRIQISKEDIRKIIAIHRDRISQAKNKMIERRVRKKEIEERARRIRAGLD